jgi:hypothetical protein
MKCFLNKYVIIFEIIAVIFIFCNISFKLKNSILKKWCGLEDYNNSIMGNTTNDSFFVYLFSNVKSHESHRENTVAKFVTKLAEKINLTDEWEVGLTEISYTKSWFNIRENQSLEVFTTENEILQSSEAILRAGYYKNIEELVIGINKVFKVFESKTFAQEVKRAPALRYDRIINRIFIIHGISPQENKYVFPKLSEELELTLGLRLSENVIYLSNFSDNRNNFMPPESIKLKDYVNYLNKSNPSDKLLVELEAPYAVQFNVCELHLLVYCSIVEPVMVGNTYSKLLRQVEIPKKSNFGDQCVLRYPDPFYHPLISNVIETIEINIKDDTGEIIPFDYGRSTITLHFRKRPTDELTTIRRILH